MLCENIVLSHLHNIPKSQWFSKRQMIRNVEWNSKSTCGLEAGRIGVGEEMDGGFASLFGMVSLSWETGQGFRRPTHSVFAFTAGELLRGILWLEAQPW